MICTLQYLLVWVMCGSKHLYSSAYVICHPLFLQLMKKKIMFTINFIAAQIKKLLMSCTIKIVMKVSILY